ncbi:MAG: hypothetical protein Q9160_003180 [Pyrenula sp. 1 TL-2023]
MAETCKSVNLSLCLIIALTSTFYQQRLGEPYDWDTYASTFFPQAQSLVSQAEQAEKSGETEKASELYCRGSALYRIARFPTPRSEKQFEAWTLGKAAALKGMSLGPNGVHEVLIPHTHRVQGEGETVPVYHVLPPNASNDSPAPCVVIYTGLDGYRTELMVWAEGFVKNGVAVVILEIPGTGDSPALRDDPKSPDRQNSSLLDWIEGQEAIDHKKIIVWGFSTGGMYAIRMAHTHKDRLLAVVALGGGAHHMFDEEWLDNVNRLEYPFDLAGSLCYKFGYGSDLAKFKKEAKKFSLLEDGTLDKECTRLFLVNGTDDEIFPVDDYYLILEHGLPKEARFIKGVKHMGEPVSFGVILKWLYQVWGMQVDIGAQLKTLLFQPKF